MMEDVQRSLSLSSLLGEVLKFSPCLRWVQVKSIHVLKPKYYHLYAEVFIVCSMIKASEEH